MRSVWEFGIHERLDTEDRFWSDWLWIDERIDWNATTVPEGQMDIAGQSLD